jgi:cobaltochelatase CobT
LTGSGSAAEYVAYSTASTLGGLRAFADRVALRTRFHDEHVHRFHEPAESHAARVFADLEDARLDAHGVSWLPGIARNLLAHPGAEDDGVRWLAFEAFSGRSAPPEKLAAVAAARAKLPSQLTAALECLTALLDDQPKFAEAAAAWVQTAGPHVSPAPPRDDHMSRLTLSVRSIDRYERPGRFAVPTTAAREATGQGAGDAAGAGATRHPSPDDERAARYRVFTTAHDRVVNAAALASRAELELLRAALDAELASVRRVVARLAKKLLRVLMSRQIREWRFDLDEGLLDASRLAPMIASGAARPFKQETDSPFPSTCITLLIDHSGSIRGRPMQIAALTVEIFARVLERCGVTCEVLGFTTRDWDGGEPGRDWALRGYPADPGRLNALEHIVIKSADVPWRRARAGLGLFMRDEMLKENIDGEAVAWAHRRLLARSEQRRILVVVSDGTPTDEATLAANGFDYLDRHLEAVVRDIEARSPVHLAAIGIGHDVSRFYRNATRIRGIEDLGPALTAKLIALLSR